MLPVGVLHQREINENISSFLSFPGCRIILLTFQPKGCKIIPD
jgi:hypothetical protein